MKRILLALLIVTGLRLVLADESNLTLTVGREVYSNVVFGAVTPYAVKIQHSAGVAAIPLAKLPPELQQRFGYDPQKATLYHAAQSQAIETAKKAETERVRGLKSRQTQQAVAGELAHWRELAEEGKEPEIRQVGDTVYNFSNAIAWKEMYFRGEIGPHQWDRCLVNGKVLSVLKDSLLIKRYDSATHGQTTHVVHLWHYPKQESVADDSTVRVLAIPCGRYNYTTTSGAGATVPDFDFGVPSDSSLITVPLPSD